MARPRPSPPEAAALRAQINDKGMLAVRVVPNAAADQILLSSDDGVATIIVRITATPEQGKANVAVLRLLARTLDVPPSALELVRGAIGRNKLIKVADGR